MPKHFFKILDKVTPGASRSLGWEVLMSAISFPASILLNRTLGAEDRGLLALVILVPSTIFVLGSCQWDRLLKGLITSKQISSKEAWRRTIYYAWVLSLIFIPFGIIGSIFFEKLPVEFRLLSIFYSFDFPIYFLCGCLSTIYIAIGSIDGQYLMRIGYQGSYLVLLFVLFFTGILSVQSMIFIYIAIHIINLAFGLFQKERLLVGIVLKEKPPLSPLIKAFLPYLLESFSTRIDIWAFSIFGSLVSLGHYTGITALMLPVGLVSNAMTSASTARLDWKQPNLVLQYLLKAITVFLCLLVIMIFGGILTGQYLLNFILGKSFQEGYWMIPWIAVIVVCQAAAIQFHTALQLSGFLNEYLIIQLIEPIVRLLIVLALGYWLSELGIMIAMIALSIFKVAVCYYSYKNRTDTLILFK
jgi:O-antigen/teichoic acid export membrane protein